MAASLKPLLAESQFNAIRLLLSTAPADGQGYCLVRGEYLAGLVHDAEVARNLDALINTPELVDFAKGVQLEAAHQEARWGTDDREGKGPADWMWLVANLVTRALEHHKEAERVLAVWGAEGAQSQAIAHHREKAVHHTITAGAALAHWHASVLGKHTAMRPSSASAAAAAANLPRGGGHAA